VEVVAVLDPNEKRAFDGMVINLRVEDPRFIRRLERAGRPRRQLRVTIAVLLWTLAPVCVFLGGWTGLLLAVLGSCYGAVLINKRSGLAAQKRGFNWWSSPSTPREQQP
jgi:hypothetical protein